MSNFIFVTDEEIEENGWTHEEAVDIENQRKGRDAVRLRLRQDCFYHAIFQLASCAEWDALFGEITPAKMKTFMKAHADKAHEETAEMKKEVDGL